MLEISNSELTTWLRCRRTWYIRYFLQRDRRDPATGPLPLGSRIHTAMEGLYAHGVDPVATVHELYEELWAEWGGEGVSQDDEDLPPVFKDIASERELAVRMVEGYLEWLVETGADEDLEVVGTEQKLVVPLNEHIALKGRLDLRVLKKSTGAVMFLDHKTAQSLEMPADLSQIDSQFRVYGLLSKLYRLQCDPDGPRADGGIRSMLKKVKRTATARPPFYKRIEIRHNDHELRATYAKIMAVAKDIYETRQKLCDGESPAGLVYPTPDLDCSWRCPFVGVCVSMDDGSRWQDQLQSVYIEKNPYAHYESENRWDTLNPHKEEQGA